MATEQLASYDVSSGRRSHAWLRDRTLSSRVCWTLTTIIAVGLVSYHCRYEGWLQTIVFAGAVTASLFSLALLLSRRALFSIVLVALLVATIVMAADVKRHYIEMVLHAYDVVFYLTSWSTLVFLWADHKLMLLALAGMAMLAAGSGLFLWQIDGTRVPRAISGILFVFCVAIAATASYAKGERRNTSFFWDNQPIYSCTALTDPGRV